MAGHDGRIVSPVATSNSHTNGLDHGSGEGDSLQYITGTMFREHRIIRISTLQFVLYQLYMLNESVNKLLQAA